MANICPCTFGNSISHALNNLRKAKNFRKTYRKRLPGLWCFPGK